ncbi:GNAT family N-acetyltransferase [Vibrio cyclitrophicus]|nr:hypothetical protein F0Z19_4833 [Vibrio cyclitrophicus]
MNDLEHKVEALMLHERKVNARYVSPSIVISDYAVKLVTQSRIITVFERDVLKGFIAFYSDADKDYGYISQLIISEDFRGIGLSKSLLNASIKVMKSQRKESCRLEVHRENLVAIKLYSNHGFERLEQACKGEMILMEKLL